MGLFRRRKKTSTTHLDGFGDAHVTVSKRRGKVPLVEVEVPQAWALGIAAQEKGRQLGPTHPEYIRAVERYLDAISVLPGHAEEARGLRQWLAQVRR
jgi:hypothetical protein